MKGIIFPENQQKFYGQADCKGGGWGRMGGKSTLTVRFTVKNMLFFYASPYRDTVYFVVS